MYSYHFCYIELPKSEKEPSNGFYGIFSQENFFLRKQIFFKGFLYKFYEKTPNSFSTWHGLLCFLLEKRKKSAKRLFDDFRKYFFTKTKNA